MAKTRKLVITITQEKDRGLSHGFSTKTQFDGDMILKDGLLVDMLRELLNKLEMDNTLKQ